MLRIFKRYTGVSTIILLCFFSAFLALCNGLLSTAKASDIIRTEKQFSYLNELQLSIRNPENITPDKLMEIVGSTDNCNVYLDTKLNNSMLIYFNEIDSSYCPTVVLKQNEPLSLPTSRSITHIPDNGIVVSSKINDDELTIHGNTFHVIEKMDCEKYPFVTNSFTLNASVYFDAFPNVLDEQKEITLCDFSNRYDDSKVGFNIKEKIVEKFSDAVVTARKADLKVNIFQSSLSIENIISVGLFLFSLINTIIILYYWVIVRRREIAIRKAFVASNFRVMSSITLELFELIGAAALMAAFTQVMIWRVQGCEINFYDAAILAVGLFLAITLATFITMIVPVRFILCIQPSEGVKL